MIANSLLTVIPTLMAIAPCKVPTSTSGALRHADEGNRTSDRPITRCWLRPPIPPEPQSSPSSHKCYSINPDITPFLFINSLSLNIS